MTTPEHLTQEKIAARRLRESRWWKDVCAHAKCHYCQIVMEPSEVTMDHVVPIVRGGRSVRGNIVPACKNCNSGKRDRIPVEDLLNSLALARAEVPFAEDQASSCE